MSGLRIRRMDNGRYACIPALLLTAPIAPDEVRRQLAIHEELVHVTVEVTHTARTGAVLSAR